MSRLRPSLSNDSKAMSLRVSGSSTANTYKEFKRRLDELRRHFDSRNAVDEPYFHHASEPPCGIYAFKYAQENKPTPNRSPVVLYEIPERGLRGRKHNIALWDSLLKGFNDPLGESRAPGFNKARQLGEHFAARRVELLIITHLHNLVTPQGRRPLLTMFEHLVGVLQAEVKPIHVLFTGDHELSEQFILCNAWVARRVMPLDLND